MRYRTSPASSAAADVYAVASDASTVEHAPLKSDVEMTSASDTAGAVRHLVAVATKTRSTGARPARSADLRARRCGTSTKCPLSRRLSSNGSMSLSNVVHARPPTLRRRSTAQPLPRCGQARRRALARRASALLRGDLRFVRTTEPLSSERVRGFLQLRSSRESIERPAAPAVARRAAGVTPLACEAIEPGLRRDARRRRCRDGLALITSRLALLAHAGGASSRAARDELIAREHAPHLPDALGPRGLFRGETP